MPQERIQISRLTHSNITGVEVHEDVTIFYEYEKPSILTCPKVTQLKATCLKVETHNIQSTRRLNGLSLNFV